MPLPQWLGRFNRRVSNPLLRPVAANLVNFGVVTHLGRSSGRRYRTPVTVFPTQRGFLIALTYGTDVDWLKNVLAERGCRLTYRGRTFSLVHPRLVRGGVDIRSVPGPIRTFLRLLGVTDFLHLDRGEDGGGAG
jgi:deazaflavin-dependent oxidoreductase (nitroreductase family)